MNSGNQAVSLFITHASPETCWLKLWAQVDTETQSQIENSLLELESMLEAGEGRPHPVDIRQGDFCCAKSSEDGKWYRARVTDLSSVVSGGKIGVKFLDYGNFEVVAITEVRKINHSICSIPAQATEFILADVKPLGNSWDEKTIDYIKETICYQEFQGFIVGNEGNVPKICIFEPNIAPHGFSHHLIERQLAKLATPDLYKLLDIPFGKVVKVNVSHVLSPSEFWVQLCDNEEDLNNITLELENFQVTSPKLVESSIGTSCVAQFSEDGCFYRAQIITKNDNNNCQILFVDFGNSEMKTTFDLYTIPNSLLSIPAQSITCTLKEFDNVPQTENVIQLFKDLVEDKQVNCTAFSNINGSFIVDLEVDGQNVFTKIQQSLCKKRFSPQTFPSYEKTFCIPGNAYEVRVSSCHSLLSFYCQDNSNFDALEKLSRHLEQDMSGPVHHIVDAEIIPGYPCCVKNEDNGNWCRAKVVRVIELGLVEIQYVDYGNFEIVRSNQLKRLPSAYARNPPVLAMECALKDCSHVQPELIDDFERIVAVETLIINVVENIKETAVVEMYNVSASPHVHINLSILHLHSLRRINVKQEELNNTETVYVVDVNDNGTLSTQLTKLPVEVLDKFQNELNACYSSVTNKMESLYSDNLSHVGEFCCSKFTDDDLFYRGKIIREDKNTCKCEVFFIDYGNSELKSFEDVKVLATQFLSLPYQAVCVRILDLVQPASVLRENLMDTQLELRFIKKSRKVNSAVLTESSANEEVKNKLISVSKSSQSSSLVNPKLRGWGNNYSLPNLHAKEEVLITYIENPHFICCQLQKSIDALQQQHQDIQQHWEQYHETEDVFTKPLTGEPCLALFSNDWRRAEIKRMINPEIVEVCYVDYGNTKELNLNSVREIPPVFFKLPKQAVNCMLENVPANSWSKNDNIILEKLIKEKKLFAVFNLNYEHDMPYTLTKTDKLHPVTLWDHAQRNMNEEFLSRLHGSACNSTPTNSWQKNSPPNVVHHFRKYQPPHGWKKINKPFRNQNDFNDRRGHDMYCNGESRQQNFSKSYSNASDGWNENRTESRVHRNYSDNDNYQSRNRRDRSESRYEVPPRFRDKEQNRRQYENINNNDGWGKNETESMSMWDNPPLKAEKLQNTPITTWESPSNLQDKLHSSIKLIPEQCLEVDVSNIYSPNDFCVQLKKNQQELQQLTDLIASLCNVEPPTLNDVKVNSFCCARYSEDNMWYRAKVTSINGNDAELLFIDYGNTETVTLDCVKELKKELFGFSAMAVFCSLDNVIAVGQEWTSEDSNIFSEITMNNSLTLQVVCQNGDTFLVNLFDPINRISIANQLVNKGIATLIQPFAASSFKESEISHGTCIDVMLSWFVSPTHFYVQLKNDNRALNELMEEMQDFYSIPENLLLSVPKWEEGMACVAQFTQDDVWYRAKIASLMEPDRVTVVYVDFGNRETLDRSRICGILTKFIALPVQAIQCSLKAVRPVGPKWTKIPREKIAAYFSTTCLCTFYASHKGAYLVDIMANKLSLAQEIINDGYAILASSSPSLTSTCSGDTNDINDSINPYPPLRLEWNKGDYKDVVVCSLGRIDKFWCRLLSTEEKPLSTRLNEYYSSLSAGEHKLVNPKKGTPCVIRSARDNQWYRATVLNRPSPSKLNVLLVDTGMEEMVAIANAKVITDEYRVIPIEAFPCFMHNVPAKVDSDEFIRATYQKELVAQLENCSKDIYSVTLFDVSQSEERNINELLIDIATEEVPSTKVIPSSPKSETKPIDSTFNAKYEWKRMIERPEEILDLLSSFSISQLDWSVGEDKTVILSGLGRPNRFWCHLSSSIDRLDEMCRRLEECYSDPTTLPLTKYSRCTPCVMKSSVNNKWYRAVIVRQQSITDVEVFLVDIGVLDDMPVKELRQMSPEFLEQPPEAFCCSLYGVDDNDVTIALVTQFFSLVGDYLTAKLETEPIDGVYGVSLFDMSTGTPENIFLRVTGDNEITADPGTQFLPAEIDWAIGETKEIVVSGLGLPDKFWCQLLENEAKFNNLTTQMENYYNSLPDDKLSVIVPVVGKAIAAQSRSTRKWFRALVKSVNHSSKVVVSKVDTGEWEKISINQIKAITSEFMEIAVMSVECRLSGIPSNADVQQMGYNFFDLIVDKKLKARLDSKVGSVLEITLIDDPTEITINERLLNLYEGKLDLEESKSDNANVEKNISNNENVAAANYVTENEIEKEEKTENVDACNVDVDIVSGEDYFPLRTFPTGKRLIGGISHIVSPGQFWVQLNDDTDTLANVTDKLGSVYVESSENSSLVLANPASGSACAAIYSEDGDWYRGKVLAVELNDVHVQFVDYGNSDTVKLSAVRKLTSELVGLPILALQCELAGVCQQEDDWSVEAIEQFEELVLEKSLVIEIVSHDEDRCVVKLFDLGMDIAIEMEKKGFATLQEGYKSNIQILDNSSDVKVENLDQEESAVKEENSDQQESAVKEENSDQQESAVKEDESLNDFSYEERGEILSVKSGNDEITVESDDQKEIIDLVTDSNNEVECESEENEGNKNVVKSLSDNEDEIKVPYKNEENESITEDDKKSNGEEIIAEIFEESKELVSEEAVDDLTDDENKLEGAVNFSTPRNKMLSAEIVFDESCDGSGVEISDQSGGFETMSQEDIEAEDLEETELYESSKDVSELCNTGDESKLTENVNSSINGYQASISGCIDSSSVVDDSSKEEFHQVSFDDSNVHSLGQLDVSCTTVSSSFEWEKLKESNDEMANEKCHQPAVTESEEVISSSDDQIQSDVGSKGKDEAEDVDEEKKEEKTVDVNREEEE